MLEMINVAYCIEISDNSLISLSKCSELKTLEIRGCLLVTPKGLAAIAPNCKQLSRLDIKKCYKIDDSGMIPLACWSQNLKQVFFLFLRISVNIKDARKFLPRLKGSVFCFADKFVIQFSHRCRAIVTC